MYKHNKSKTASRVRIMSLGPSDKPEKWLGKHFNFLKDYLKWQLLVFDLSGHHVRPQEGFRWTSVPVNVVQRRLLIVSMGEGDSGTGDLEGSGACTQRGLVKTHICNPHLRDIVTTVHTERASKARKVGRERIDWRHPSASENLGHISFDVGRDDNIEYSKLHDNDPY